MCSLERENFDFQRDKSVISSDFVMDCKNLRRVLLLFFSDEEEGFWKGVFMIEITVLPNRKADCRVIK